MLSIMTSVVITSKWQVTIPEEIRKEVPSLEIGQRLRWEVVGGVLTAKPVRTINELAGCLKSDEISALSREEEKAAIERARVEHYTGKHRKI
jgi:bifunctional DNA-binding transcriptional regulator/antitoxin component of YhaV-PrlF toxin-antitoxin module